MLTQVYDNTNVLEATEARIRYLFDEFEDRQIIVSVSGGKDSTILAILALKEAHRRNRKIGIFFLDEEVVYESSVAQIEYIMSLYPENTIRMWLQIPFHLTNATSYSDGQLVAWEPGKHKIWMRSKGKNNIIAPPWGNNPTVRDKNKGFGFYDAINNFESCYSGAAFLVGLRGTESPNRWRAMIKNPGYKDIYWCTRKHDNYAFYPLYDWNFSDVWKYIYENNVKYSKIYDYQFAKKLPITEIRVSSLIHEKSFKALVELPEFEPRTYDKLCKRVRGIQVGCLYGKDKMVLRTQKLPQNYKSWQQYRDFLLKTYPDSDKKWIFEKRFTRHLDNNYVARQQCRQLLLNDYENNLPVDSREDPREALKKYYMEVL